MYLGRVVEQGPAGVVLSTPLHPYTKALLAAVPQPDPSIPLGEARLGGDPPSPIHLPAGCRFAGRCPLARPMCRREDPALVAAAPAHEVACWAVTHPERWNADGGAAPVVAAPPSG
jgi:oligopeptide/dipeptide ABC transporter ATP-binding protein